jgi:hypothetical protein
MSIEAKTNKAQTILSCICKGLIWLFSGKGIINTLKGKCSKFSLSTINERNS